MYPIVDVSHVQADQVREFGAVAPDLGPAVAISREAMRAHLLACGLSEATAAAIDGGARPAGAVHELRSALRCTLRPDLADELATALAGLPGGAAGYAVRASRTDDHKGAPHEVIARDARDVPAAIRACWAAQYDSAGLEPVTAVVVRPLAGGTI
jgi:hypothetical protein